MARVTDEPGFSKFTTPGPLNWLHRIVRAPPAGTPSSVAVPLRRTVLDCVRVWSGPALTTRVVFTVTETSSLVVCSPSLAVRRRRYAPLWPKVAVVAALEGLAKVTLPGPLTLPQPTASVELRGKPSSVAV